MRIAMPIFGSRISPRFVYADTMLVVEMKERRIVSREIVVTREFTEQNWPGQLEKLFVDVLVCGGIESELRAEIESGGIRVIANVAADVERVIEQLEQGSLLRDTRDTRDTRANGIDCVGCELCANGMTCPVGMEDARRAEIFRSMEITMDIAAETDRVLCRVAEVVYYCLEMGYRHVGLAFCAELFPEARTIVHVFRRFFRVTPVCCKIGGLHDGESAVCNPLGMAWVVDASGSEFNIAMGLCIGCDVQFARYSRAPHTTLVVKDRLLANNPIAAVYSKYQLEQLQSLHHKNR